LALGASSHASQGAGVGACRVDEAAQAQCVTRAEKGREIVPYSLILHGSDWCIGGDWTCCDVEVETDAGYYEPIKPAMKPWQYERLNTWLHDREEWARTYYADARSDVACNASPRPQDDRWCV
jgi:hypothetical protein